MNFRQEQKFVTKVVKAVLKMSGILKKSDDGCAATSKRGAFLKVFLESDLYGKNSED